MNENASLFRAGWNKVSENPTPRRLRSIDLWNTTKASYVVQRKIILADLDQLGFSTVKQLQEQPSLQLNLFNDYVNKTDVR